MAEDGPTLEATLSFIATKLQTQDFTTKTHSENTGDESVWSNSYKSVNYEAKSCTIRITNDRNIVQAYDLSKISDIRLSNYDSWRRMGGGNYIPDIPISVLELVTVPQDRQKAIYLPDESVADRIAKAFVHAVKLCGGMKSEAF